MQDRFRKLLVVVVAIALLVCIFRVWFSAGSTSNPALSVMYVGVTDGIGHWKLRFAISNVGDTRVFTSKVGEIDVLNRTNRMPVGATAPMSELAPRQGHVIYVVLSDAQMKSIDEKWRYTCLYGPNDLRSRIYHWQWGPTGPGARINWLIPQKLKGMPLSVKGTSDWIEPTK